MNQKPREEWTDDDIWDEFINSIENEIHGTGN